MYRQRSDDRYVHSALFKDMQEAQGALDDIYAVGLVKEELSLAIHTEEPTYDVSPPQPPPRSDGKRGLILGICCGGVVGLIACLLLSQFGVLSGFFAETAFTGLFVGMIFGGLGGGLYGTGLTAAVTSTPPKRNCFITAKTANVDAIGQVEGIFEKHHGIAPAN